MNITTVQAIMSVKKMYVRDDFLTVEEIEKVNEIKGTK